MSSATPSDGTSSSQARPSTATPDVIVPPIGANHDSPGETDHLEPFNFPDVTTTPTGTPELPSDLHRISQMDGYQLMAYVDQLVKSGEHFFSSLKMRDIASGKVGSDDDFLTCELELTPSVINGRGTMQGGIVATFIDVVAGRLTAKGVPKGWAITTMDMTIHFVSAITQGPARAEARIVRRGRRVVVVEVKVWDMGHGRIAAQSTIAFQVLEPRS